MTFLINFIKDSFVYSCFFLHPLQTRSLSFSIHFPLSSPPFNTTYILLSLTDHCLTPPPATYIAISLTFSSCLTTTTTFLCHISLGSHHRNIEHSPSTVMNTQPTSAASAPRFCRLWCRILHLISLSFTYNISLSLSLTKTGRCNSSIKKIMDGEERVVEAAGRWRRQWGRSGGGGSVPNREERSKLRRKMGWCCEVW